MDLFSKMTEIAKARIAYYRAKRLYRRAVKIDDERWSLYQEGARNGSLNGVSPDDFMAETRKKRGEALLEYIEAFDRFCDVSSTTGVFFDPLYWIIMFAFAVLASLLTIFFGR